MIPCSALVALALFSAAAHADSVPPAPAPTSPVTPVAAPVTAQFRAPGMDSLTPEELAKYQAAIRASMEDPEVKAASAAARKARLAAMEASQKLKEAQDKVMAKAGPDVAAILAKVDAGRRKWLTDHLAKLPKSPAAPAPGAPAVPPVSAAN